MKQTNSAIKFLMAQYRAIFKNANLKMFLAATAAAVALSSGAAQAKPGDNTDPLPKFETELADSTISEGETLTHDAAGAVVLKAPEGKPVVINGGKLALGANATNHIFTANDIILNKGSIDLQGVTTNRVTVAGLEGAAKDPAVGDTLETASLTVNGGELNIKNSFIQMKNVNLAGGITNAGGVTGLEESGSLVEGFRSFSNIYAWGGAVTVSNNAVVNLNPASGINTDLVKITGGTVNLNGQCGTSTSNCPDSKYGAYIRAGNSVYDSEVSITGGTVKVADGKHGDIRASYINMNGGNLDVAGTLTIGSNFGDKAKLGTIAVTGGKVNNAATGTVIIDGNASFADGTLNNQGNLQFKNIPAGEQRTLTIGAHDFNNNFLKAEKAKLSVDAVSHSVANKKERFDLVVTGNETLDLIGSGFLTAEGGLSNKVKFGSNLDNSTLSAKNATIGAAAYSAPTVLAVESLTAGKSGAFTIDTTADVVIGQSLTVTPKDTTADLTVKGSLTLDGNGGSVNANKIILDDANSSLDVDSGKWTAKALTITSGNASVSGEDTALNLTGMLTTTANGTLNILDGASVDASAGDLNLVADKVVLTAGSTLILDSSDVFKLDKDTVSLVAPSGDTVKSTFVKDAVTTDATSILKLKYNGEVSIANLEAIKTAIATDTKFKGFLKLEGASIKDRPTEDTNLADVKAGYDGLYNNVAIKVGNGGSVDKSFTAGQIKLTDSADIKAALAANTSVMLTGAKGDFVVKSGGGVADVSLASGTSLVLAGNGSIGSITATGAGSGSVVIGHSSLGHGTVNAKAVGGTEAVASLDVLDSTLNVAGTVNTGNLALDGHSSLNITAKAGEGAVKANTLNVDGGSKISASGNDISVTASATIKGDVTAATFTLGDTGTIENNATVTVDKLVLGTGTLTVGNDDPDANGTATVITKNLTGTGTLFVDPAYGQKAALVIAESLSAPPKPQSNDAGTLSGSAVVGNNAALGIGFSSEAELHGVIGQFLDANGSFTEDTKDGQIANALVLNKKITVADTKGITLKKDATAADVSVNQINLGAGTAIIITDKAFGENKTDVAITMNTTTGTINGNGGKILLSGKFDAKDKLEIFKANTTTTITAPLGIIEVSSINGLLSGSIAAGASGKVENLSIDEAKVRAQFAGVSTPVQDLLVDTLNGEYKDKKGLGTEFVYTIAGTSLTGVELDAAVHAATFAGAQQAAVAAVGTMADAIGGRVGSLGAEASAIAATGSQANGGVWLSPMYKSVDADGFNAQGATYGADVDLAGVAFGVDTVNGDMRFGAVFNIGSGDSDGKGNGSGLKDEFDYYGFGIYSVMGFGQLALVGDASLNVISHDVEGFGLKGSADTTAITLGLTGQYAISTPMVDVVPHAGMRFTRLDTDSYDVNGAKGTLANTDFDVQNVFSIPLGVTLSKAFEMGGWALAPSADFTLTFNTGDTEVDSTTHLKDMTNLSLNTEVLDEVTYGINLGLGAQFGSFGAAFGLNYTGSENTDAFGVNANARYMF